MLHIYVFIYICVYTYWTYIYIYFQLPMGWHRILRLFLKTFNWVPGAPGFYPWDLQVLPCNNMVLIIKPWRISVCLVLNWKLSDIISRFCATLSPIGCIYKNNFNIYLYKCIWIHIYATYVHINKHVCTCIYVWTYICTYIYISSLVYLYAVKSVYKLLLGRNRVHIYIYIDIHECV